jgi:hypothetical protein
MSTWTQGRGLFAKFRVERLTSSSRGIDHTDCRYFVLDITHDPHALPAALTYADSCESEYPFLAQDIRLMVRAAGDQRPLLTKDSGLLAKSVSATAAPSDQDPSQKEEGPHA